MAVISRVTTWSDGQVLTASALNGEFNGILNDYNGNITNANISASAAIAYSKLNLTGNIVNADINASAAIAQSKLATLSITETLLSLSDLTTADVSTTKHGLVPKAPNDTTKFLRGDATWAVPSPINFATSGPQAAFSSNSATFVDVTGATLTVNPTGTVKIQVVISGRGYGVAGTGIFIQLLIDGTIIQAYDIKPNGTSQGQSFTLAGQATLASGARVIKMQMHSDGVNTMNIDQANVNVIWG